MRHFTLSILLFLTAIAARAQQQQSERMFILGGELSNSAATSTADIDEVMPRMRALGLNTVLVPAYWEFLEPQEGHFDYTLIDRTIEQARQNGLKVVFLWFGAWKNSMSCYAPLWFKQDTRRFPRAQTAEGKPLEIASCFSTEVLRTDQRAFEMLIRRIAERGQDVVTMVQVENEIGMLEDARDHAPLAEKEYKKGVPTELVHYLQSNAATLHPWLQARLQRGALAKKQPAWTAVFGDDLYTDEIFMAYSYARYVEQLCQTARRHTQLPLYVNAAMNSRGRRPGQYPSAGPLAHLIDLWHAGAPTLAMLSPDIYDTGFKGWAAQYALPNNRLFIPESRCCLNSGVRSLYAFGEHHALGFSPFAIDQASSAETASVTAAYGLLRQLEPYVSRGDVASWGLLFDQQDKERIITDGDLVLTARHNFTLPWDPRATDGSEWPEGGGIIVRLQPNEYLIAGSGLVVSFATRTEKQQEQQRTLGEDGFVAVGDTLHNTPSTIHHPAFKGKRAGIGFVDQVRIGSDGQLQFVRRDNGDQDHQGRHARIGVGEWKILHVKLYEY